MATAKIERVDFYGVSVEYHHIGDAYVCKDGSKLYRTGGMSSGHDTYDEAREKLIETVRYYEGIDCQVTKAVLTRYCSHCQATGHVASKKRGHVMQFKACPACLGKDTEIVIETWIGLPEELYK